MRSNKAALTRIILISQRIPVPIAGTTVRIVLVILRLAQMLGFMLGKIGAQQTQNNVFGTS
jgi:hypothetical protein